ncbi:MAG: hypothetical protein IKP47_10865 [Ruminococcus sp.]|nr:hypothetical protein [Ruminococcus sp.]
MSKDNDNKLSPEEREAMRLAAEAGPDRRSLIEHTRIEDLTDEEIEARKRAHAERKAERRKASGKKSSQGKPDRADKKDKKAAAPSPDRRSQSFDDEHSDRIGRRRTKPAEKHGRPKDKEKEKHKEKEKEKEKEKKLLPHEKEPLDMDDFRRERSRLKSRKRLKRLIIVLILAIIAAAVYYTRSLWVPKLEGILDKKHDTIVNEDGVVQSGNFPLDIGNNNTVQLSLLDGSLISVDGGHIFTYDTNGKLRDTAYHSYGNPVIRSEGKRLLLYDFGGTSFKLYNKTGEMFDKRMESSVMLGALSETGSCLIVTEDDKYRTKATIFDKNGTVIYTWQNGDKIVDAEFCDGGDGCVITTFTVANGRMISSVHYIDITKSNSVITGDEIEGLVLRACKNKEGCIWAVTKDRLSLLSEAGQIIGTYDFSTSLAAFDICGESACLALDGIGHDAQELMVFDASDLTLTPKRITEDIGNTVKIRCFDGMAFVLGTRSLCAYAADGSLISTAAPDGDYKDFVYSSDAVYLLGIREINKLVFKT